ncbi:magnesium transporter [Pelagibius litoralis]|uniref:Magnesium transporter MgtE n=1 Tax=Pelagibius litoralis TaxID=374515 RepID=A0A967F348_9PROT|nr:magnesium transporter [Pelagibius litoralis]NIA72137.1 magnesium transporter [Pelagibius litoralis]
MAETPPEHDDSDPWLPEVQPDSYGISAELVRKVAKALAAGKERKVHRLVIDLHEADLADLLEHLDRDDRPRLIEFLGNDFDLEVLTHLDSSLREELIEAMEPRQLADSLSDMDSDDAVDIFEDLDEDAQREVLEALPRADRLVLEESLSFPEDSAGRIMQRELLAVPSSWTVGQTIDYMRAAKDLPDDFYDLYIVDPKHQPIGFVPLSRAMRTKRPVPLTDIMTDDMKVVPIEMDQEEVAYLFRQYGLVSAPVVDPGGRLVGVVTVDDVVHIIDEEAEEDLLKLAGVKETDLYSAVLDTTRSRFSWLLINLFTAVAASIVIAVFEETIERVVALAVLMPIVASMGGNAGTQTLTVAVRALAMRDLSAGNAWRFVGKEVLVGLANGLMFAVLAGALAWLWFDAPMIGVIIGAAMVINLVVAALSGALVPLGLEKLGVDPAVASSVLLTTVTDVIGFFAFLGLATVFLL